jgi:hypothetical protein
MELATASPGTRALLATFAPAQMTVTIMVTALMVRAVASLVTLGSIAPSAAAQMNARDTGLVTSTSVSVMKVTLDLIAL